MMTKERLRDRAKRFVRSISHSAKHKSFSSFSAALLACDSKGYDNSDISEVVVAKTIRYRDQLNQFASPIKLDDVSAFSLAGLMVARGSSAITVLDFGGAAGAHYFLARAFLPSHIKIKWIVVETVSMTELANRALASDELTFVEDLDKAKKLVDEVDLIHSSGTIQCLSEPYSCLRELIDIPARYMLLNRLFLTKGPRDLFTTHDTRLHAHGPGTIPENIVDRVIRIPATALQESKLSIMIQEKFLTIAYRDDASGVFPIAGAPVFGKGLLAKRM